MGPSLYKSENSIEVGDKIIVLLYVESNTEPMKV